MIHSFVWNQAFGSYSHKKEGKPVLLGKYNLSWTTTHGVV